MSGRLGGTLWQQAVSRTPVNAIAVGMFDGEERIVSGGGDGVVRLWNLTTGVEVTHYTGHTRPIRAVAIGANGLVASASEDATVRLWREDEEIVALEGHTGWVMDVAVAEIDGTTLIASGGEDGIRIWNATTKQLATYLPSDSGWVSAVAFCSGRLLTGGEDGTIRIWDPTSGLLASEVEALSGWISTIVVGKVRGRDRLIVAGESGIGFFDLERAGEKVRVRGGGGWGWAVALSEDDDSPLAFSGTADGMVRIWDAVEGDDLQTLVGHTDAVRSVATTSHPDRLVSASRDGTIRVWRVSTGATLLEISSLTGRTTAAAVIDRGERVITGGEDGTVRVWSPATGKQEMIADAHRGGVRAVCGLPDGLRIATGGDDAVRIWDIQTGRRVDELTGSTSTVTALTTSSDGETIVVGDATGKVLVWDPNASGEPAEAAHSTKVVALAWAETDDEDYVVSGSDDRSIMVWRLGADRTLSEVAHLTHGVTAVAVGSLPNQSRVIFGSKSGLVRTFAIKPGEASEIVSQMSGHSGPVLAVAGEVSRVVSVGADGTVRFWDSITGVEVQDHLVLNANSLATATIDGDVVASIDDDGLLSVERLSGSWRMFSAHTALPSDKISAKDEFGAFDQVAQAVARFLLDPRTEPPVTIGIKGPWGGGKSSIMKMIQNHVDDGRGIELKAQPAASQWARLVAWATGRTSELTAGEALAWRDRVKPDEATPASVKDPRAATRIWRPTVWFNPWHFQTGEQVWAGLATTVIDEVTSRMGLVDRERFFLGLNWARVDQDAVRRRIHRALWRAISVPVAALLAAAGVVAAKWGVRWALGGFSLASLAVLGGAVVAKLRSPLSQLYPALVRSPASLRRKGPGLPDPTELVRDPGHRAAQGAAYLTYVDLKRVIDLVATPEQPLIIFVDDLDRCSPSVVVQTLEALNLFLAGPFRNCSFVVAIEPSMLAAHVATLYTPIVGDDEGAALELGWRFLEKMIHLPVVVPRPNSEQAARYLTSLLPPLPDPNPEPEVPPAKAPAAGPAAEPVSSTTIETTTVQRSASGRNKVGPIALERAVPERRTVPGPVAPLAATPAEERFALDLAMSDEFRAACSWAAEHLVPDFNPRQLKRLLALVQLYTLIANRLSYLRLQEPERLTQEIKDISVFAALIVRWPEHIDRLQPDLDAIRESLANQETPAQDIPDDVLTFLHDHHEALTMAVRLTTLRS